MKEKLTTIDLIAVLRELNQSLPGMRVVNVYDIDQKTYLIKLAKPDKKVMLLFESGCRIHTTEFEWPKSLQPSGFSMKLRKHLRSRRLVSLTQLGVDRVVDLQFGSNEAAYHIIIELYDRGNVILTDCNHSILSLLRTRTDADTDVRFATRQAFTMETIKMEQPPPTTDQVQSILSSAKAGDQLRHILNPHFVYGSSLLSHCLLRSGFSDGVKIGSGFDPSQDLPRIMEVLREADTLFRAFKERSGKGYLIQKRQAEPKLEGGPGGAVGGAEEVLTNVEFHPMLFKQHEKLPHREVDSFDKAVDEFYSSKSSQKQDLKALSVKKTAVKKLDNIRKDHFRRIEQLQKTQEEDAFKAQLIEMNSDLVTKACLVIRSAVANAMAWSDIELFVKDAQSRDDPVACAIKSLKLKTNEITMLLYDPGDEWEESESNDEGDGEEEEEGGAAAAKAKTKRKGTKVDIDLGLSAFANATRYYGHKKHAAKKEQKTLDASEKALKSAEKKAKQTLKEASAVAKILKARKVHWFEKFYWFISSENYLVIGGRDQQQNELIVKRHLREGDVYVHADIHGATSVIVKNNQKGPIPPKTLNEAGFMAVCYSSAWDARIVTSAWWVYHNQVSKTAPTGEYLTTGSFMIRGKKNFLPPCQLVLGFGFLFRVEDGCIPNHLHERKVKGEEQGEEFHRMVSVGEEEEEIAVEEEEGEGQGEEGSSDEGDFPDTALSISHVSGDTFELQRGPSVSSTTTLEERTEPQAPDISDMQVVEGKPRQHLTAKQKRDLKKQAKNPETPSSQKPPAGRSSQPQAMLTQQPQQQQQYKRRQKFKQKKAKEKYGDQDEEERQLMMDFLASAGAQKEPKHVKKGKGGKKKSFDSTQSSNPKLKYRQKEKVKGGSGGSGLLAEQTHKQREPVVVTVASGGGREEEEEGGEVGRETEEEAGGEGAGEDNGDIQTRSDPVEKGGKEEEGGELEEEEEGEGDEKESEGVDAEVAVSTTAVEETTTNNSDPPSPSAAADEDERDLVADEAGVESDEEEKKALLAEENITQLEEAEKEQLTILDALTGCPLPDDLLLYAIPVCGPYSAMLNYKYKVKLIPGNNRRGKAAKAALQRFTQSREAAQREKDLLKSVKDNDLSRYIPGKVKMSLQSHKQQHR